MNDMLGTETPEKTIRTLADAAVISSWIENVLIDMEDVVIDAAKSVMNLGAYERVKDLDVATEFVRRSMERLDMDFHVEIVKASAYAVRRFYSDGTFKYAYLRSCTKCDDIDQLFEITYADMISKPRLVWDHPRSINISEEITKAMEIATIDFMKGETA